MKLQEYYLREELLKELALRWRLHVVTILTLEKDY